MKVILLNACAVIALAVAGSAIAASDPMVGGAPMLDNKNIIQKAVAGRHLARSRAFHRVRADQRSFRCPACRDRGYAVEARKQGYTRQDPDLSRRTGPPRFGDA